MTSDIREEDKMSNADSMKTGGATGAVGPSLMKRLEPARLELKDMLVDEKQMYHKVYFSGFESRLRSLSFKK